MKEKKTYIINIDGMRADYFNSEGHQGCLTPTLVSLAEQGTRFSKCKALLPAITATNHTSILTSTHLGTHGICGMWAHYKGLDFAHLRISTQHGTAQLDSYKHRHLQCLPTFFNIVKMNNPSSTTAFIAGKHWVGELLSDEDCDILIYAGNQSNPDYVTPSPGYILGSERHEEDNHFPPRIYIPHIGDRFVRPPKGSFRPPIKTINANLAPSDKWIIDQAIQTICHHDPDFMYILLCNMDTAGHFYGSFNDIDESDLNRIINPDAMKDQLFITDSEIKRFIDFLKRRNSFKNSRIIITSDHGMSTMKKMKYAVDVRKVLAKQGMQIRANTRWLPFGYKDKGNYEWCFSEGTHFYIYCREDVEKEIKNKIENHLPHVVKIFDKEEQINQKMWKDSYEDVIWPRLIVFLEPNYMNIGYSDVIAAASSMVAHFKPHIQSLIAKTYGLSVAPGTHGTICDQDVPLIFVSPSESEVPSGVINNNLVSVIDIIPTINFLNGWSEQKSFEGKKLLS